jgi:hypothetical protein
MTQDLSDASGLGSTRADALPEPAMQSPPPVTIPIATVPTYAQLVDAYRDLIKIALTINDCLRRHIDHVTYEGSMNDAGDLCEIVNDQHNKWHDFIYEIYEIPR